MNEQNSRIDSIVFDLNQSIKDLCNEIKLISERVDKLEKLQKREIDVSN